MDRQDLKLNTSNIKYISFPSKTFLIGEYAVLEKSPAILVNTNPRFGFEVREDENSNSGFHSDSPAGQWLKKHPQIKYHIKSHDPHNSRGGFGFSSAQFNLVYLLGKALEEGKTLEESYISKLNLLKMWTDYRNLDFKGHTPSGADVVSQWIGKMCLFSPAPFHVNALDWPFKDLDFFLIHTGMKFNTWEHLQEIKAGDFSELADIAKGAVLSIKNKNEKDFISAINEYAVYLEKKSLVHNNTSLLLNRFKEVKSIVAAKGCGAMGAEVVAVFFHPKDQSEVESVLKGKNIICNSNDLTYGVQVTF